MTGSQVRSPVCGTSFSELPTASSATACTRRAVRDLSHMEIAGPRIVSASTSRGDTNMRKFILIAGFVLASAAAQAGDRSLSLGRQRDAGRLRRRPGLPMHRKARKPRKHQDMSSAPRSSSPGLRRAGTRWPRPGRPGRPGCIGPLPGPRGKAPVPEGLWLGERRTCRGARGRPASATGSRASSAHCTGTASIGNICQSKTRPSGSNSKGAFSLQG